MRELETHPSDNVKAVAEIPVKRESKLLGTVRKIKGLTLFEFNVKTKELVPATYEKVMATYSGHGTGVGSKSQVKVRPDCIYFQALNIANAKRKLRIQ